MGARVYSQKDKGGTVVSRYRILYRHSGREQIYSGTVRPHQFVAMTANAFAEDVQASMDAGMNGHLSKPIAMEEVEKTIARNLRMQED